MIQRIFIPIVVKVYIGMSVILYTAQKIKSAAKNTKTMFTKPEVKFKTGF